MLKANTHIHTPYSFSSFSDMEQAFKMAVAEDIKYLGINDFNVTDGYKDFYELAQKYNIHPLFNIEIIAFSKELQNKGIRVNDPVNPGRFYLCGKGLNYPSAIKEKSKMLLARVNNESQRQMREVLEKLNVWLQEIDLDIVLNYEYILKRFARNSVRERHIAQALRTAIFERYTEDAERDKVLQRLYGGESSKVSITNVSSLDNELRNNLFKAGKRAFVAEDEQAFVTIEQACEIIIDGGGMPCYPVLLDGAGGTITEFEADKELLLQNLTNLGINCIELIPHRNKLEIMEPFVRYFYEKKFSITFGTEHNTPELLPLTPYCSEKTPLTDFLLKVNYEGAKFIAAHQNNSSIMRN